MRIPLFIFTCSILSILMFGCASNNTLRKPIFESTTYKGEKGEKGVNNLNKNRAEREKEHFLALEKADEAKRILEAEQVEMNKIDTTERVGEIEMALQKIYERTEKIIEELNSTSPYSFNGHEKTLKLAAELNDLMQNYIEPLTKMIEANKEVKKIGGDISFNIGSSELNNNGKKEISKLIKSIKTDIKNWDDYLENHNVNIFKDSVYRLMIIVNGYADAQGDEQKNLQLSKLRAESVANEILEQVNEYDFGQELLIDVDIKGRGEATPPNLDESELKANSPERRISRVSMVVGPKILLYEN
ncbi:MAG: OmpA family protein [Crocinitomicaceae bacterium]|nr:OmpA family protein [Crocinitomicaceae bacterium]